MAATSKTTPRAVDGFVDSEHGMNNEGGVDIPGVYKVCDEQHLLSNTYPNCNTFSLQGRILSGGSSFGLTATPECKL
jgi:hypothetical protein